MKDIWLSCWIGCVISTIIATLLPIGGSAQGSFYLVDEIFHLLIFTILIVIPLAKFTNRKAAFFCIAVMPALGFSLEYLQNNVRGREFSPEDMLVNNIGVLIGIAIGVFLRLCRRYRRENGKV